VLGGLSPRPHVPSPVVQVIGQGAGLLVAEPEGLRVDQPGPDLGGFGFLSGGHRLGFAAVGATLPLVLNPVGVNETVIPDPAALA